MLVSCTNALTLAPSRGNRGPHRGNAPSRTSCFPVPGVARGAVGDARQAPERQAPERQALERQVSERHRLRFAGALVGKTRVARTASTEQPARRLALDVLCGERCNTPIIFRPEPILRHTATVTMVIWWMNLGTVGCHAQTRSCKARRHGLPRPAATVMGIATNRQSCGQRKPCGHRKHREPTTIVIVDASITPHPPMGRVRDTALHH